MNPSRVPHDGGGDGSENEGHQASYLSACEDTAELSGTNPVNAPRRSRHTSRPSWFSQEQSLDGQVRGFSRQTPRRDAASASPDSNEVVSLWSSEEERVVVQSSMYSSRDTWRDTPRRHPPPPTPRVSAPLLASSSQRLSPSSSRFCSPAASTEAESGGGADAAALPVSPGLSSSYLPRVRHGTGTPQKDRSNRNAELLDSVDFPWCPPLPPGAVYSTPVFLKRRKLQTDGLPPPFIVSPFIDGVAYLPAARLLTPGRHNRQQFENLLSSPKANKSKKLLLGSGSPRPGSSRTHAEESGESVSSSSSASSSSSSSMGRAGAPESSIASSRGVPSSSVFGSLSNDEATLVPRSSSTCFSSSSSSAALSASSRTPIVNAFLLQRARRVQTSRSHRVGSGSSGGAQRRIREALLPQSTSLQRIQGHDRPSFGNQNILNSVQHLRQLLGRLENLPPSPPSLSPVQVRRARLHQRRQDLFDLRQVLYRVADLTISDAALWGSASGAQAEETPQPSPALPPQPSDRLPTHDGEDDGAAGGRYSRRGGTAAEAGGGEGSTPNPDSVGGGGGGAGALTMNPPAVPQNSSSAGRTSYSSEASSARTTSRLPPPQRASSASQFRPSPPPPAQQQQQPPPPPPPPAPASGVVLTPTVSPAAAEYNLLVFLGLGGGIFLMRALTLREAALLGDISAEPNAAYRASYAADIRELLNLVKNECAYLIREYILTNAQFADLCAWNTEYDALFFSRSKLRSSSSSSRTCSLHLFFQYS